MSYNGRGSRQSPAQASGPTTSAILQLQTRWNASSRSPSSPYSSSQSAPPHDIRSHDARAPAVNPHDELLCSLESTHPAYSPALPPLSLDSWRPGYGNPELSPLTISLSPVSSGVHIAFVNEIPPEILAEIFVHTLPLRVEYAKPDRWYEPLVISHVCRYWRDVAINLPTLWQRISLRGCPSVHDHRPIELARLFADRARGTDMLFEYSDYEAWLLLWKGSHKFRHGLPVTPADQRCYCALDFIISHIAQIRVLELNVVHASCRRLAALPPGAASVLREISAQFVEGGEETQVLSRLYATSPQMVHFSRKSYLEICSIPLPVDVPWHQLVSAHIDDSPVPHTKFLEIMAAGQSLAQLQIILCHDVNEPLRPLQTPITQNCLQSLIIHDDQPLDAVLQSLRLPSLREVRLRSKASDPPVWPCNDVRILRQFIEEISGGLDVLDIWEAVSLSEGDLIALLQLPQTASLTTLQVCGSVIQDTFFTLLDPAYGSPLAPHLTKLIIDRCAISDGIIADMIASRRQYLHPLRSVHIVYHPLCQGRHSKDISGFQFLKEQYGMRIWPQGMSHDGRDTPNTRRPPAQASGSITSAVLQLRPRWDVSSGMPFNWHSPPASAPDDFSSSSRPTYPTYPSALPPLSRSLWRSGYSTPELSPPTMTLSPGPDGVRHAPTNELPPEILAEIFTHTLPPGLQDAALYSRTQPLLISHVCHYWRDVAINLPSLWRQFFLLGCPSAHDHRHLELARLYVERARGTGLLVRYADAEAYIVTPHGRPVAQAPHLLRKRAFAEASDRCFCALEFLISHIAQIYALELVVAQASVARLSRIDPHAASMLRELSLEFLQGGPGAQALARLHKALPKLTQFIWRSFRGVCVLPPPMDLPCEQLVDVYIGDTFITSSAFLGLMSSGQRLRSVYVRLCPDVQPLSPLQSRIHQSELRSLTIRGKDSLDAILGRLQLPSLRELILDSLPNHRLAWPCNDAQTLHAFIAATSVGLETLKLSPADNHSEADLLALLQLPQMATLTWLMVDGPLIQDAFFTRMDPAYGPPLAPVLEKLIIHHCICATTDGTVAGMIASRKQYQYPLKIVHIDFDASEFRVLEKQYDMKIRYLGWRAYS
ncbi:hypothetical protein EV122DRAFT_289859 [Schizophyllum commune]